MHPRRSSSTHTEQLGDEASVYDWANAQVHALNPTAARVWQRCDGGTSPDAIAADLHRELGIPEAEAVVHLTLEEFARLQLLEQPVQSYTDRPAPTRRWLLGRGLAAAMLPAVYTILAPSPLEAQSSSSAPTLTSVSPAQGTQGTTIAVVTLTGTNFVVGATTVNVSGAGVTITNVVVGSSTSLTATFALGAAAAVGIRTVTVTTAGGTSNAQNFTINPGPGSQAFAFTGALQVFTVPAGVTSVTVTALGAQGGRGSSDPLSNGGRGGQVVATLTVVPGAVLNVFVGGAGQDRILPSGSAAGGFNGGGISGFNFSGGGGGGASDVRSGGSALSNRVIVAGGGGGGATSAAGGAGGQTTGGAGGNSPPTVTGGGGGTSSAGGAGGVDSSNSLLNGQGGLSGIGGAGGPVDPTNATMAGAGGGGGYFGGGGGAGDQTFTSGGGGGGGSSFTDVSATGVTHTQGIQTGNGQVTINW